MGDNRSYAALEWVIGEIGESLNQARQALEAYVDNTEDTTRIRFCLTHIHQVYGSLQMVEFYGAALLAEEMENLAKALMNKSVRNESEAQEVLMRAILQLPVYLNQVKSTRKDNPAAVLPLLNDLRAVRGESLLTETKLFTPNLAPAHRIADRHAAAAIDPQQFLVIVHKLRQMYQYAAAGVIRNVKREENIAYLYKIFARLRKLTKGTARQPLWDISLALVEGLEHEAIESSATVKNLLRQLDKEIKVLAEQGVTALNKFTNDELIKNLLYYVAQASRQGKYIDRIKQAYNLEAALPQRDATEDHHQAMAPDLDAIRSVVDALKDELDSIKNSLDISLSDRDSADIAGALPIIKRVADTMAVLGIGDLRKQVLAQGELLESVADRDEIPADVLMKVADQIIEIESALDSLAAGSGRYGAAPTPGLTALDQAQASVLRESRNGLEQAKDAIIEYIASQWNRDHLANVPRHLRDISGGLDMIPLRKPSAILRSCANFIEHQLLQKAVTPEWSTLDTLADAIASVEYYLERLTGDREEEDELLLSVAEDSVEALGYPIGIHLRSAAAAKPAAQADVGSVLGKFAPVEEVELALPEESAEEQATAQVGDSLEAPIEQGETEVESAHEDYEFSLDVGAGEPAVDGYDDQPSMESVDDHNLETSEPVSAVTEEAEDDLIDQEILEIFIEEAQEVLEAINEYFPRWADDFEDEEALAEFRRAFHTLKGSGRMVNANDIGELAWAVESMLNRIIDNTVEPNDGHVRLIQRVIPLLPDMVQAFEHRRSNPHPQKTADLSSWAEALSRGEKPAALFAEETDTSEVAQAAEPDPTANDDSAAERAVVEQDEEDDAPDTLLWDIFGSEAATHLEVVEEYIAEMDASAPLFTPPSDQMQRALHTLKGSAHMADVKPIAELVAPLERFVKELRIYQVNIDSDILQLMKDGVEYIQLVLAQIDEQQELEIPRLAQYLARVAELKERSVAPLIRQKEALEENAKHSVDPELLSIFMAEEMKLLLDVDELIFAWRAKAFDPSEAEPVIAELATLERGSEHANLPPMASLSRQLREVYESVLKNQIETDEDFYRVLLDGHAELLDMVDAVAVGQNLHPISEDVQTRLDALIGNQHDRTNDVQAESAAAEEPSDARSTQAEEELTLSIEDLPGGEEIELVADDSYHFEEAGADESDDITIDIDWNVSEDELQTLATVEESESDLSVNAESDLSHTPEEPSQETSSETAAEQSDEKSEENTAEHSDHHVVADEDNSRDIEEVDLEVFEIFIEEAEELLEEIDEAIHDWEEDWSDTSHVEALKRALHTLKGGARLAGLMGLGELAHEFESFLIAKGENVEVDQSFFDVVHEYQDKLISGTDKVKRRVAGHVPDGLEEVMQASENFDDELLDQPADASRAESSDADAAASDQDDTADEADSAAAAKPEPMEKAATSADILPFAPKSKAAAKPTSGGGTGMATSAGPSREFSGPKAGGGAAAPARRSGPQEVIKVSAELLEELVNLAGETSISRGRLEEQNTELNFAIDEMESTVHRLQEQLRRLDIETEAQMIFRQEQMEVAEEFDPLEMDRYSQLQQLSRSLMESASDLMDLTTTLGEKTRGTETLLLQQSRINTDLQEGLMRSRMVPFSRMVPRLRRIVRQISTELDKQVSFELSNVEGELDRSVLERMVAPLEHMLRNAVDHGIESPEERRAAGKPESGTIALSLGREGGDILMRLSDDGRGLNLARIRAKAVERGLMAEGAQLSDQDIMQFILHAGFSTAEQVTQISGRGVGMDVVHSEIKQLGGSMFIDSRQGEGTEFIIRLPFTVSVNRALMIQLGDDNYAIPLNSIEGIVRVSPFELEHYYQDEDARFEYAGEQYRVRYLGNMLDRDALPRLDGQVLPLPVVLVRSAEHAVAIQVDKLMGSREIVVKSLGPQFATVEGLSGATVMGDGSVVVILDPNAIIRKEMALLGRMKPLEIAPVAEPKPENRTQVVLVVDDSVTVRKVTSRFLEREGYEVMTAKDGADALLTLQDHIPDIMLLDIEMPRMDGFEVAKNVRSSSRLKDIPIIMITSRTGEKHRERAFGLGVNKYLGKPYQEEVLLSNIHELIGVPTEH